MDGKLTAAILIVSTTAAEDPSTDASASVLRGVLAEDGQGKWEVRGEGIVSDNVLAIQRQITQWTDGPDPPSLIITTGGTGFAVSDGTPEVSLLAFFSARRRRVAKLLARLLALCFTSMLPVWFTPCWPRPSP